MARGNRSGSKYKFKVQKWEVNDLRRKRGGGRDSEAREKWSFTTRTIVNLLNDKNSSLMYKLIDKNYSNSRFGTSPIHKY